MIYFAPRPNMLRLMGDLADLLEHGRLRGEFNMSKWGTCGTAACAYGWGRALLPSWKAVGICLYYCENASDVPQLQLTDHEVLAAFMPWELAWTLGAPGKRVPTTCPATRLRNSRAKTARIIRWLVEREKRRQADEHVLRLNGRLPWRAWGMDREALAQRARERRKAAA